MLLFLRICLSWISLFVHIIFRFEKFIASAKLAFEHLHMLFFTENLARAGFVLSGGIFMLGLWW